ncbi:Fic family protein [Algoriphagus antarcticus]|uniref:Fic/DOC family protein n=1 Tax=Algoriphagus antarcticus TaxID=238540 RepID=A0A3E0D6V4_9BACT|nr:Fic family protein [Algoriphagus antarcticus]REG78223.1 Fic/DOC family protein [Algoriphagus antarcticus]
MDSISKTIALKNELDKLRPISREQEDIIMQKFRLDWNYHSNNLEGNSLTFGETRALILFGITAQGKPLKDHFEITGHDQAIKWVMDVVKGDYPLTETFIRELHTLLLKEPYEVDAITPDGKPTKRLIQVGQYKSVPNHVLTKTGEIFRFATSEETPSQMHDLIYWYRAESEKTDINPILLATEFHYKFIRIHPFDDGNGRLARILMNFILIHFGYPPLIIKTEDKLNYFAALRQADAGIIAPFFEYIASNLIRSLEIMISGANGESIEEEDDLDMEIALLKAKMISESSSKKPFVRSKEMILEFYDNSVVPLWKEFIATCSAFDDFYLRHEKWVETADDADNYENQIETIRQIISEDTSEFILTYQFFGMKKEGSEESNFTSRYHIKLGQNNSINFKLDNSQKTVLKKTYGSILTREEIKLLCKEVKLMHTKTLSEKV